MSQYRLPEKAIITKSESETDPCYDYAVRELKRLLGRVDVRAEVRAAAGPKKHSWLLLASDAKVPPPVTNTQGIKHDGFTIDAGAKGISIAALRPKGILNGVYELAERLGFIFLMPGEEGEWAPDLGGKMPSLKAGRIKLNPRFPHRGVFGGCKNPPFNQGEWFRFFAKLKFNAVSHGAEDLPLAQETGIRLEAGGHGMSEMLPRELFEKRPELFRMFQPEDFGGKRMNDSNFCANHPAAKRIVQENFRKKIRGMKGVYAVHSWADDLPAGGWCLCPLCRSYTPTDQSMIAMRHFAEVIAQEKSQMRIPVIAYHDTMYPGRLVPAPKEGFLLFAPRERCYSHALDDPSCAKNRFYFKALNEWTAKFAGIGDAHTFEYYFDQILFRGLYPFIPDVILGDMAAYHKAGIETHMSLQVGGPVVAPEFNMLVFARGNWDASLTSDKFIADLASQISPTNSKPWAAYLQKRRKVFASAMRLCEYSNDIYFDYRWLPETVQPFGREMARAYECDASSLDKAADELSRNSKKASGRAEELARKEAGRAHFEAAELRAMASQQDAVNKIAKYVETGSIPALKQGLGAMRKAISRLELSRRKAKAAGLPDNAYTFALSKSWLEREFRAKIKAYAEALD